VGIFRLQDRETRDGIQTISDPLFDSKGLRVIFSGLDRRPLISNKRENADANAKKKRPRIHHPTALSEIAKGRAGIGASIQE
jgi:hypothetical protein